MFLCYTYNIHTAQSLSAPHQGLQPVQRSQLPNLLQMGPDKQDKRERKAWDFAIAPGKQLLFHPLYTLAFLLQRLDVTVKDLGPFLWRSLVNLYDHFPRTRFPFMFYTIQYKFSQCSVCSGFLNLIFFLSSYTVTSQFFPSEKHKTDMLSSRKGKRSGHSCRLGWLSAPGTSCRWLQPF